MIVKVARWLRPCTAPVALIVAVASWPPRRIGVLPGTAQAIAFARRWVATTSPRVRLADLIGAASSNGAGPGPGSLGLVGLLGSLGPDGPGRYEHDDKNHDDYCG